MPRLGGWLGWCTALRCVSIWPVCSVGPVFGCSVQVCVCIVQVFLRSASASRLVATPRLPTVVLCAGSALVAKLFAVPWLISQRRFLLSVRRGCRGPVPVSGHVYPPLLAGAVGCGCWSPVPPPGGAGSSGCGVRVSEGCELDGERCGVEDAVSPFEGVVHAVGAGSVAGLWAWFDSVCCFAPGHGVC